MDKDAVLGELVYLLSRREKARIPITLFWKRAYVNSLKESLAILSHLIDLLENSQDVKVKEMIDIFAFIERHDHIFFGVNHQQFDQLLNNKVYLYKRFPVKEDFITVNDLMHDIIKECTVTLVERKRKYKQKVYYLLAALHNLPKVYLNPNARTLCNIGVQPISMKDALDYAASYMRLKNNLD